ncbi:phage portal protein [Rhizorhabdus histidinilytica]|uniref:phage portal protein n=1 Tax=Rhizorhabdus histidinilytica TaxID=439228 RepID=UPI00321F92D3
MTWLDDAIGWVSPQMGARRLAYRHRLDLARRSYDAARRDHRTSGWHTAGSSANAEIAFSEEIVRNRTRDLGRNNGWACQILDTFADHAAGTGIVGAPMGLKARNQQRVGQAWMNWGEVCDHDGDHDLPGLLWLATKGMAESGASLIRFRRLQFDASTSVAPLSLQVLEPDFIDPLKDGTTRDGGLIDRGIEYDAKGRKVAYWLLPHHPGDVASWRRRSLLSERVPADEVVYLYQKLRPGQDRGMPLLAPAVMTLRDLDSYFDAELVRKRIESCLAGFIQTPEDDLQIGTNAGESREQQKQKYGKLVDKFEPGMLTRLHPGEQITINKPSDSQGVSEFAQLHLREAAAAAGVMYEHATGDFSGVNYSSWRAGHHGFRRRMERVQWHVLIHKACRPIQMRWREAARAAALLPSADFGWRWTPPGFISVDPYKDAQADLANLRMGKVTLRQLVEERGYDFVEQLLQLAEDLKSVEDILGSDFRFDGDPRKALNGAKPSSSDKAEQNDAAEAA